MYFKEFFFFELFINVFVSRIENKNTNEYKYHKKKKTLLWLEINCERAFVRLIYVDQIFIQPEHLSKWVSQEPSHCWLHGVCESGEKLVMLIMLKGSIQYFRPCEVYFS